MESVNKNQKSNKDFKKIADLLFFTDRTDIDRDNFKKLLRINYSSNVKYLLNRFEISSKISWEDSYWNNRISFLFSLKEKKISKLLENKILKNAKNSIKFNKKNHIKYDVSMLQFLELCKVKPKYSKNLFVIKSFFLDLIFYCSASKMIKLIKATPDVFSSFNDYFSFLCKKSKNYLKTFTFFKKIKLLENDGIQIDKQPIFELIQEIVLGSALNSKTHRAKFFIFSLSDKECFLEIKKIYNNNLDFKSKVIFLIKSLDFNTFRSNHFIATKNLFLLDSSLEDEIISSFLTQLFSISFHNKNYNIDQILSLIKHVPNLSLKKILSWLSLRHKKYESNYLLNKFTDLNKLAAFI
jgi:hypothetical protein